MTAARRHILALVAAMFAVVLACAFAPPAAHAAEPSVSLPVKVEHTLSGKDAPQGTSFAFAMEAEGDAPLPASSTVAIKGTGSASFGEMAFTEPGVFSYRIYQVAGSQEGFTYDSTVYSLQVVVSRNEAGSLVAQAAAWKEGSSAKSASIAFESSYVAPSGKKTVDTPADSKTVDASKSRPTQTGDSFGAAFAVCGIAALSAVALVLLAVRKRRRD